MGDAEQPDRSNVYEVTESDDRKYDVFRTSSASSRETISSVESTKGETTAASPL